MYYPGFDITATSQPLGFRYGPGVFGPAPELRSLDSIRPSLLDPDCDGPDPVYAIAMDVGREQDREELVRRNLLYGAVTFAAGRLGDEPVRSQGHVHAVSGSCGCSTPELYEVWSGTAFVLMQESDGDNPGRCFAVRAEAGQLVVVPPGWAHATISGDPETPLVFGAWCVRDFGFVYDGVRTHHGLAWFPKLDHDTAIFWEPNPAYPVPPDVELCGPRALPELGLVEDVPIYTQYTQDPERLLWICEPHRADDVWAGFTP